MTYKIQIKLNKEIKEFDIKAKTPTKAIELANKAIKYRGGVIVNILPMVG